MNAVRDAARKGVLASLHPLTGGALAVVREERASDFDAREALLDAALGEGRFAKASERLREGRLPARGLALIATVDGEVAGTVRLWHIRTGDGRPALLLGPLAVKQEHRALGIGGLLMREAIARAAGRGHSAIILVGDEAYYRRFGFDASLTCDLDMPGPVDRARFLALELKAGALDGACGMLSGSGAHASIIELPRAA
ncbi:MAG: N-acetyltransferase [Alphaproteobacteria bacterium]|nr:N-acetyltransferase [Alphaproteobacteria bacterium]